MSYQNLTPDDLNFQGHFCTAVADRYLLAILEHDLRLKLRDIPLQKRIVTVQTPPKAGEEMT